MDCLVIGCGSIGHRHCQILEELGARVAVVSTRAGLPWPTHGSVAAALAARMPGYVVVANASARHFAALEELARLDFTGRVLVEKPLFDAHRAPPANRFSALNVAYNLRFDPLLQAVRQELAGAAVHTLCASAGQHLAGWRPGRDYRTCYSARRSEGGGVLRDLSHELDYVTWLLGGWRRVAALGGRVSDLEIDSDDAFALLLDTPACPIVQIHVDYLDRIGQRTVVANLAGRTLRADLVAGELVVGGKTFAFARERNASYRAQHQAMLGGAGAEALCSLEHGVDVLRLIAAAERAAAERSWVER